jgi:hypothetical protein
MSTAETILVTLQSVLTAAALGASVERDRVTPLDILPGIVIKPKDEESTALGTGLMRCMLMVEIEIHTRGDVPSTLADPIAVGIQQAIVGAATLNGLTCKAYRTGKSWEYADADGTGGKLTLTYQFHYAEPA